VVVVALVRGFCSALISVHVNACQCSACDCSHRGVHAAVAGVMPGHVVGAAPLRPCRPAPLQSRSRGGRGLRSPSCPFAHSLSQPLPRARSLCYPPWPVRASSTVPCFSTLLPSPQASTSSIFGPLCLAPAGKPSGPGPLAGVTMVSSPQCSHHCGRCMCVQATPRPCLAEHLLQRSPPRRWCSRRPPLASRLPRPSFATPLPCRSIVAWLTPSQCRGRRGQPAAGYARPGRVFSWARAGTVMGA
jgi:hypothetical protein